MAASPSSSFTSRNYTYKVFASFHGEDVRKTLLSHIRQQFNRSGISMFDDQEIERSATIAPSLKKAIKESRISIVILSQRYASSGWCLDELVDIMETKKATGQIVMPIFYGVEPSHIRKQIGEFGIAFNDTCERKKPTDEQRQKWSQALNDVGNIEGDDFSSWDNEAKMIKKITKDVSEKLNVTPSKDFDGMVGLEAHLKEMESLLDLDYGGVKMVAITGPAGIGKTTIARALHSLISNRFQLDCFVDNLRESYHSGFDEYGLKLGLQKQFLSDILNQYDMRISHLGAVKQNLGDQRVLIILDDVNNIKQLEALANDTTWFGPGSRIIVTTENKELLQQHGIDITYHVPFPSYEEALKILCRYAFRESSMYHGFEGLATRVTYLCGNLPLGLRVVGSSLRGKNMEGWEKVIRRLETIIDHKDIENVLRVGFESLDENEQSLFLHIAVFFNYKDGDLVKAMLADTKLDIKHGLEMLVNRSLIYISDGGKIMMHTLLQQVATKVVHSEESWKQRILINAPEICDVLEHAKGTRALSGISFDIFGIDKVSISKKAFKKMPNLRFLRVYKSKDGGKDVLRIPKKMEFPCRHLRLLQWEAYPNKCLPPTFYLEHLVKLDMSGSKLKYLWLPTL
uniref:Putative disease resistance protein n=2 Tax=Noccaea caerulescens TaxID=107243 RepID=A0A1J3FML4_NOCCA